MFTHPQPFSAFSPFHLPLCKALLGCGLCQIQIYLNQIPTATANSINAKSGTENTEWVFTLLFLIIFRKSQMVESTLLWVKGEKYFLWGKY